MKESSTNGSGTFVHLVAGVKSNIERGIPLIGIDQEKRLDLNYGMKQKSIKGHSWLGKIENSYLTAHKNGKLKFTTDADRITN